MRTYKLASVALAMIAGLSMIGCDGGASSDRNGNISNRRGNQNIAPGNQDTDHTADEDEALILSTQNNVFLKLKGAASFVPIFGSEPFHAGDTLRVGDQSKAVIFCKDACELGTGEYLKCCIPACKTAVDIQPPPGDQHKVFMMKKDLPESEARLLQEQESKINSLGLGKTVTQFLRANLYTSWKLNEATGELESLDQQLDKPEAKQELSQSYPAVMLKTADLFVKVDQKDKAIQRYKKTIEATPETGGASDRSAGEKAAAHSRLAEIYASGGQKAEAIENLSHAREIYARQGDQKKVQVTDTKILRIKAQP